MLHIIRSFRITDDDLLCRHVLQMRKIDEYSKWNNCMERQRVKKVLLCCVTFTLLFGLHHQLYSTPYLGESDVIYALPMRKVIGDIPLRVYRSPTCKRERTNIVLLKIHKTGTTTTVNILHRFGLRRNLTFMLPVKYPDTNTTRNIHHYALCFPYPLEERCYMPLKKSPINILCHHIIFNEDIVSRLRPSDSIYITIVREPFARFKSAFNYFAIDRRLRIPSDTVDPLLEYLRDIPKYEAMYAGPQDTDYKAYKGCRGNVGLTQNIMAFGLGVPTGFNVGTTDQTKNATYIKQWIDSIQSRFSLVMVSEYYIESMVLFRRLMCWKLTDLLYLHQNVQHYKAKDNSIDPDLLRNFERHNEPDYILYNHFNATLWRRIGQESSDFWDELRKFKALLNKVTTFCNNANEYDKPRHFHASKWNEAFTLSFADCSVMQINLLPTLIKAYQHDSTIVAAVPDVVPGC